jgi:hypothetical protein
MINNHKIINILIIILILILISIYIIIKYKFGSIQNCYNDIIYDQTLKTGNIIKKNLDRNKKVIPYTNKNRILLVSYDDRSDEKFILEHNKNITAYADKYGYTYKYISNYPSDINTYWKKIFIVRDELQTNQYDYVMWLDTDTIILNFDFNLNTLINSYNADLFLIDDNIFPKQQINAGVFIIKNTSIGKSYINDIISSYNNLTCIKSNSKILKGIWGGTCYEQGQMNIVLNSNNEYLLNCTVLPREIFFCGTDISNCFPNQFLFHYYGTKSAHRFRLFYLINSLLKLN